MAVMQLSSRRLAAADLRRLAPAAAPVSLAVAAGWISAASGGYFPASWGWGAVGLAWIAALALVLRPSIRLGRIEVVALVALVGFTLWTFASFRWSASPTQTVLEGERSLLYLAGLAAALLSLRRRSVPVLLGALVAAIVAVAGWGLLTRLVPDRVGVFEPFAGYRLSTPIGYWNGLGILAAVGTLVALGLAARATSVGGRAAAGAAVPVLLTSMYFTFSRGAWVALACGLVLALALDARRLQLLTAFALVGAPSALALAMASQADALVRNDASILAATPDGHRVLGVLALCAAAAAALAGGLGAAERRVVVPARVRLGYAVAVVLVTVALLGGVFARYGSPVQIVQDAQRAFVSSPSKKVVNLNERLFSFSGNGRSLLWSAARDQWQEHRLAGSGAGSYEQYWLQNRELGLKVRDAHNLYLETLAELGPIGLGLLVLALGAPLVAGVRARRSSFATSALGAYGAFLLHAAVDWDWELAGVTLAALFVGASLLVLGRRDEPRPVSTPVRRLALVAIAAVGAAAFVGLIGNLFLDRSVEAAEREDWRSSISWAQRAERFAPWSSQPWRRIALAQSTATAARPYFLRAIAKDSNDWRLWMELTWASKGKERERALAGAMRLNPWSYELGDLRRRDTQAAEQ